MTRLALISTITLLALAVASRPASAATAPVTFSGAITDNYKAKYNVPAGTLPNARETRTWLKLQAVAVNGVIYTPATRPAADGHSYTADEAVVGSDGSSAVVSISSDPGVVSAQFIRTDADGWGPLVYLVDVSTLQSHPVHLTLTVTANGAVVGSSVVDYLPPQGPSPHSPPAVAPEGRPIVAPGASAVKRRLLRGEPRRVGVRMVEDVAGPGRIGCELERLVRAGVAHEHGQLVGGAAPEERDLDAVVLAVVELCEERLGLGLGVECRLHRGPPWASLSMKSRLRARRRPVVSRADACSVSERTE